MSVFAQKNKQTKIKNGLHKFQFKFSLTHACVLICFCELVIWLNQSPVGLVPNLIIYELLLMFHEERVGLLLANPQLKANKPTNFRFT